MLPLIAEPVVHDALLLVHATLHLGSPVATAHGERRHAGQNG